MTLHLPPGSGRRQRLAVRALSWLPTILLEAPERVALKTMCILVGFLSLFTTPRPGSFIAATPWHIIFEWSVAFIVGGALTLVGMHTQRGPLERLGLGFFTLGCLWFAGAVFLYARSYATGIIFLGIAGASLIRLGLSSIARKSVRLVLEAEDDHRQADDDHHQDE